MRNGHVLIGVILRADQLQLLGNGFATLSAG